MPEDLFDQLLLFQNLTPDQRLLIRPLFTACDFYGGTTIFEQGEATNYLYLVVEGEVVVRYKPEDGPAINVTRVGPEGVVGWSAALGSPAYTSAAVCSTPVKLLRVKGSDLGILCEQHPEAGTVLLELLATVIAQRLRNTHPQIMALLEQGIRANHFPIFQGQSGG